MTIVPPATIGMLGGGQLGRYALLAARIMGYRTIVLDPDPRAPASRIADEHLVAAYDDPKAIDRLADVCVAVTTEFENPPADTLRVLATRGLVVAPGADAVAIAQDRIAEKGFLTANGFAVAPHAVLVASTDPAAITLEGPGILKTARLGYDGKGQRRVDGPSELTAAWADLGRVPSVLEQRVPLDIELSVLVARSAAGAVVTAPVAENRHVDGILDVTVVPAGVDQATQDRAVEVAVGVAEALQFVGVLAVELFVSDGTVLVNELAPRPHNSGHWTLDAAVTSQFEEQVRAVCGLALTPMSLTAPAVAMVNLLGDRWRNGEPDWAVALADPAAHLHLYGKAEPRPGRKMGHLTVTASDGPSAAARAIELREQLTRAAVTR